MIDLNDLRLFERVAALRSFAAASRELDVPRSSVSRGIQRLEEQLGIRLLQRTTREVTLTDPGSQLFAEAAQLLWQLNHAVEEIGSHGQAPRGTLRISTGIGFGVNVLSALLPAFARLYPEVDVVVDLSSRPTDIIAERVDVAIRMGALPDAQIIARRLGVLHRYCCASPDYLTRHGTPLTFEDLRDHDLIDLPVRDGRKSTWTFLRGDETREFRQAARITVNCALTIHKMLLAGGGIGLSSGYLCCPEFETGGLVRLFPDWSVPPVAVHALFPTQRQLAPAVRAFVDFMIEHSREGQGWQCDPLAHPSAMAAPDRANGAALPS